MYQSIEIVKSLPNNKIMDWSKLKALADNKLNSTEKMKFVLGWVKKHCVTMFSKGLFLRVVKNRDFVVNTIYDKPFLFH